MAPVAGDSSKHQFGTSMPQGGHPPHHSITLSARSRNDSETVRPIALAVLRLMTSSYLDACSTALEDFVDIGCGAPNHVVEVRSVAHETARFHVLLVPETSRQPVL